MWNRHSATTTLGYGVGDGPTGGFAEIVTRILLIEVTPLVERSYHVSPNRDERAIAGLSMGGAESIYTALNNPEQVRVGGVVQRAYVM